MYENSAEIHVSDDERINQALTPDNLAAALGFLGEQGYVIVRDVFTPDLINALRQSFDAEWQKFCAEKPKWRGGGKIIGHLNLIPPKRPEFIKPEILGNRIIHSITSSILGENLQITGIGGNANLANSVDQYFHSDLDTPDENKLMVNIPLGDVDEQNGSLELIPGFNRNLESDNGDAIRANTRSGTVIIRYPHVLHRGKRNPSSRPRFMFGVWLSASTPEHQKLSLDPLSPDILPECIKQFEDAGLPEPQPVFGPNYFAPTPAGLVKEIIYRIAPGPYLFLVNRLRN